jgi:hypothetical protein
MLEPHGLNKDDFDRAQGVITDLRKLGYLPLDIVSDDVTRAAEGVEEIDDSDPVEHAEILLLGLKACIAKYRPVSFWDNQQYYLEMMVEKGDLRTLFSPICQRFSMAITNSKGWSDLNCRAAVMRRFKKHELAGRQCVLLYAGDHDPDGLRISETLYSNLSEVSDTVGWNPSKIIIERFGLNYDFIVVHKLTWIDGLGTGAKKGTGKATRLDDPDPRNHKHAYVQNCLKQYGAYKVEANALVTVPAAGRRVCLEAIAKYVDEDLAREYRDTLKRGVVVVTEAIRNMLTCDAV